MNNRSLQQIKIDSLNFEELDMKLSLLQNYLHEKIVAAEKVGNEALIKLYLRQQHKLSDQRIRLRKTIGYEQN